MDELIIRSLLGQLSAAEADQLAQWREASPANERRYHDVVGVWETTSELRGAIPVRRTRAATPAVGQRIATPAPASLGRSRWLPAGLLPWAVAAAAVLTLGIALWRLLPVRGTSAPTARALEPGEFLTKAGEMRSIPLEDGSIVRLGPASRLRVLDVPDAREVWLEGRAFFAVAKQNGRPFRVRSRAAEAVVLGTRFDLRTVGDELDLVVVEGRVALSSGGRSIEVAAGERSGVANGVVSDVRPVSDTQAEVAWVGRFLVFESMPLRKVAAELTRVFGIRVEFEPGAPVDRLVTGWFGDQTVQEVLSAICLVTKASCSLQDSLATIGP